MTRKRYFRSYFQFRLRTLIGVITIWALATPWIPQSFDRLHEWWDPDYRRKEYVEAHLRVEKLIPDVDYVVIGYPDREQWEEIVKQARREKPTPTP